MTTNVNRRRLIQAAGIAGGLAGIGLTSACSRDNDESSGERNAESDGDSSGGAVTVAASEVPVGSGVVVDNTYAVVQPSEGDFRAFSAICTHQGCTVGTFTETEIVCPCHSSRFSTADGSVLSGPAEEPLPAAQVAAAGGELTISAG